MEQISNQLAEAIQKVNPPRPHAVLRENIEVIIVALAVAMAFRTYFVQPFKIPTSSMYPTLAGIHYIDKERKEFSDYFPFNLIKWAVFGQTYIEVKAQSTGLANISQTKEGIVINVGGIVHNIHPNMSLHVGQNDTVLRGQVLASGMKVAGDHIFVNKVKWNFMKPERGEIMVFKTDGIKHPQILPNQHYVKRMVGLPGESMGIVTPGLYINGKPVAGISMIDKIQACLDGYNGYIQAGDFMAGGVNAVKLSEDQYFACGDNQRNSLDSRYWGPVPRQNLVGPAFFVYWPFSANWGPAR
jgi:signal peptidase I